MKIKTSVTLSEELIRHVDRIIKGTSNRSAFVEEAIRYYINHKRKEKREKLDLDILNRYADKLNKEARDVLSFQVEL